MLQTASEIEKFRSAVLAVKSAGSSVFDKGTSMASDSSSKLTVTAGIGNSDEDRLSLTPFSSIS